MQFYSGSNYYDEEDRINEYELSLFVRSAEDPELYRKYQEVHYQKAYTLEKIKTLLEKDRTVISGRL